MMNIQQSLQEFGMTEREATIYTTLLQIGEGSILDIAKNSSLKRPTIYTAMEALENKGLIYRVMHGKRTKFKAAPPQMLQLFLKKREQQLTDLLPQLEVMSNSSSGAKPEIRYFEGKEAVMSLYRALFTRLDKKDEIYFISSIRDLKINFAELMHYFDAQSIKWQWKVREIVPHTASSLQYVQEHGRSVNKNSLHSVRLLPKGLDLFDMEMIMTKNAIILISVQKEIFALSMHSQAFVESFRSIFQAAWMVSIEPK
ncbi:MAG: TrmB family transcriptional regulator [Candidatus Kerfeldbacteria bacterium]|nr:TrmB family transcriptional regulator [Candidatus Kerfeldbacteria bacterium]